MARLQLNKSSLAREQRNLETYARFLPSLDLKRQQLMAERAKARRLLAATEAKIRDLADDVADRLPMLANEGVDLAGLARVSAVHLGAENVVGARLPTLESVDVAVRDYARLAKPHWADAAAAALVEAARLNVRAQVEARRAALLDDALAAITQRVNLFEKVLIPRAKQNIKRIRVYLSDEAMTAVVRSKIAKRKRAEEALEERRA